MTDRINALVAILNDDIREDDERLEPILTAIAMIKGVAEVRGNVANIADAVNYSRAKQEVGSAVMEAAREAMSRFP